MRSHKINSEALFALGSVCCLLVMRYYETVIYFRNINIFLDKVYSFMVIPLFYFLISACIVTIFIKLSDIKISNIIKRFFGFIDIIFLLVYIVFLVLKFVGYISIGIISFVSMYWIIFIIMGVIFAVCATTDKESGIQTDQSLNLKD